ncbi:MAG: amidohydrolase family protein [Clostridia bacterium]|nr:amidohydrolase family protein [Clostridia bacterium]
MLNFEITDYDKYVYEKELRDFLPDEFIDFHTHLSKKSFERTGKHNGGSTWTSLVYDEQTAEDLLDAYNKMFTGKTVTPMIFGGCIFEVKTVNNYVHDKGIEHKLPTLYRTTYDMDADELEAEVKKGGFLGLKPYLSNCPPYLPPNEIRIFDFLPHSHLEKANKNGWIVMLHIPRPGRLKDKVNLAQLAEIEEKYPNIKLIIAHIGRAYAKEDIGNAFDIVGKGENTYFDFTANLCDDAIRACINAAGTKKLIFGSDMPIAIMRMYRIVENGVYYNIVPRGLYGDVDGEPHMRETDETDVTLMMYEQLKAFKRVAHELRLPDRDIEAVMRTNAEKLLNV